MPDSMRRTWISLSSSVILFNKWVLDTLQFRMLCRIPEAQEESSGTILKGENRVCAGRCG